MDPYPFPDHAPETRAARAAYYAHVDVHRCEPSPCPEAQELWAAYDRLRERDRASRRRREG